MIVESVPVDEAVVTAGTGSDLLHEPTNGAGVYSPQISVILKKVINRNQTLAAGVESNPRLHGSEGKSIDLTPYLGRGSAVTVRRSVHGPDTGQFSITIPDKMEPTMADSIYGLVEPMDMIEIRMSRGAAATPPIVMRGFVSNISRTEMATKAGMARNVIISGQDYSKILNIIRLIYLPSMIPSQLLLSSFRLFLNYGIDTGYTNFDSAAQFVEKVVLQVAGEYLDKVRQGSGGDLSPVLPLEVEAVDSPSNGQIQPFGVQEWDGGSIYELLSTFGDVGPWNELFVEDRQDGPFVVYRPTPYRTAAGDYIQDGAGVRKFRAMAADVVSMQVSRTDANVSNYFWVDAPRLVLVENVLMRQQYALEPAPQLVGYQNADPLIYGTRLMKVQSNQGVRYDGQPEPELETQDGVVIEQVNEKRRVLIENNKDNSVWENGTLVLKGSERLMAGSYLTVDRDGFEATFYIPDVEHNFVVGGQFTTTATAERGTGFIARNRRGTKDSAYLAEMTVRDGNGR